MSHIPLCFPPCIAGCRLSVHDFTNVSSTVLSSPSFYFYLISPLLVAPRMDVVVRISSCTCFRVALSKRSFVVPTQWRWVMHVRPLLAPVGPGTPWRPSATIWIQDCHTRVSHWHAKTLGNLANAPPKHLLSCHNRVLGPILGFNTIRALFACSGSRLESV